MPGRNSYLAVVVIFCIENRFILLRIPLNILQISSSALQPYSECRSSKGAGLFGLLRWRQRGRHFDERRLRSVKLKRYKILRVSGSCGGEEKKDQGRFMEGGVMLKGGRKEDGERRKEKEGRTKKEGTYKGQNYDREVGSGCFMWMNGQRQAG